MTYTGIKRGENSDKNIQINHYKSTFHTFLYTLLEKYIWKYFSNDHVYKIFKIDLFNKR